LFEQKKPNFSPSPFAASGNTKILKFLLENLENPADINVTDHINATPAHDAAEYGQTAAMLVLLQHGADTSIPDQVRGGLSGKVNNLGSWVVFFIEAVVSSSLC